MSNKYTPEQIEKIMETLPAELKEAFFSTEMADIVYDTCKEYGIKDKEVGEISDYVGQVLMGVLPPSEFQKIIEEEVGIPKVLAEVFAKEFNRFIFYPVKPALEQLYSMDIASSATATTSSNGIAEINLRKRMVTKTKTTETKSEAEKKPQTPAGKDIYREEVE